jgi:hypothetical protein
VPDLGLEWFTGTLGGFRFAGDLRQRAVLPSP